jgi:hypothetical protein
MRAHDNIRAIARVSPTRDEIAAIGQADDKTPALDPSFKQLLQHVCPPSEVGLTTKWRKTWVARRLVRRAGLKASRVTWGNPLAIVAFPISVDAEVRHG